MFDIYIALGIQVVAFVVWIIRLEMRLKFLQESYDAFKILSEQRDLLTVQRLDAIMNHISEMRTDIKWLIKRINGGMQNEKVV